VNLAHKVCDANAETVDRGWEVYGLNADGSNQKRLSNNTTNKFSPLWSPDGRNILFTSLLDNKTQIFSMQADGSHPTSLTDIATFNSNPDWSCRVRPVLRHTCGRRRFAYFR
jgi:Tol biopolymer transport system component